MNVPPDFLGMILRKKVSTLPKMNFPSIFQSLLVPLCLFNIHKRARSRPEEQLRHFCRQQPIVIPRSDIVNIRQPMVDWNLIRPDICR